MSVDGAQRLGTQSLAPGGPVTILPGDPRYVDLVRGVNQRWVGTPQRVYVVRDADEVLHAVQTAVDEGLQLAVRSGGHCVEQMVGHPDVRVLIDMSEMNGIAFDPERNAFAIEPGATLGQSYRRLYKQWGVTIPGGSCPSVGLGGHVAGGGYGPLARRHGFVSDHLYAVEVVVVDAEGRARLVVATRDEDDPNRDLWWAHSGGGGGNFGVVTRYWLRSPGAEGTDPTRLLPKPPSELLVSQDVWLWPTLTEESFTRLVRNHNEWYERNSDPDSPYNVLYSGLWCGTRASQYVAMSTQIDASVPNAEGLLKDYLAAVGHEVGVAPAFSQQQRLPWLHSTSWSGIADAGDANLRFKIKAADVRRGCTDEQIARIYRHLSREDYDNARAGLMFVGCGGRMNALTPVETAIPQRDTILKLVYSTHWAPEGETERHIEWLRDFFADVYAETGGVPVPNETTSGSYINNPDFDVQDDRWNKSGVPWHEIYYQHNYPRLQQVKAAWDPRDVFHHPFAVRLPESLPQP